MFVYMFGYNVRDIPRTPPKDALNTLKLGLNMDEVSNVTQPVFNMFDVSFRQFKNHLTILKYGSKTNVPRFLHGRAMVGSISKMGTMWSSSL